MPRRGGNQKMSLFAHGCWAQVKAFLTLGGRQAGTQFHAHGPAFLLLAAGKKRVSVKQKDEAAKKQGLSVFVLDLAVA